MSDTIDPPSPTWQLRFQSGPLKGRTVPLQAGENVIGSSGGCSVMLPGDEARPRHLVVQIGELVVSLQREDDAPVQLNGEPMQHLRRSAMPGDVIGVGSMELLLEQVLPAIEPVDPMFDSTPTVARVLPHVEPVSALQSRGFKVGLGLLATAIVALMLLPWAAAPVDRGVPATEAGLDWVRKLTADYPEVEVVANGSGSVMVRGFVESSLRKQGLLRLLEPHAGRISASVRSADEVVEQATRFLADPGIAVSYQGKGRLLVSGTARDESVRERIRHLGSELHPDMLVTSQVAVRDVVEVPRPQAALDWKDHLPARLVSITSSPGGMRYLQLANGARYFEGAMLKSGVEIKRIEADGTVILSGEPRPATAEGRGAP